MLSLVTPLEQLVKHYAMMDRHKARKKAEEEAVAMQIVLEHCHPTHLGELPPSPKKLLDKASLLDLI